MTCIPRSRPCHPKLATSWPRPNRQLTGTDPQPYLDLVDWRRRVGDLYRISGADALIRFRQGRDELFRTHLQSPIEPDELALFSGLHYFDHDPPYPRPAGVEPAHA